MNEAPISRKDLESLSKEELLALIKKRREERKNVKRRPYIANMTGKEFKRLIDMLPNPESVQSVLNNFSKMLGRGSSREVFDLGPQKVLKVAFNRAGLAQNHNEIEVWEDLHPFVPKVYDYHPQGYWIEMEKVDAGYTSKTFSTLIYEYKNWMSFRALSPDEFKKELINISEMDIKRQPIADEISNFIDRRKDLNLKITNLKMALNSATNKTDRDKLGQEIQRAWLEMTEIERNIFGIRGRLDNMMSDFHQSVYRIYIEMKKENLSIDQVLDMFNFMVKLWEIGISDLYSSNIGFSKRRGIPVVLDFGFKKNDKTEEMYWGDRSTSSPNFSPQQYLDSTRDPNPRITAESFFMTEQEKKERKTYIANSTVEEFKRLIEMIPKPEGILAFLEKFAKKLGSGSSRHVFDIAPNKVLKVAFNKAGLAQNEAEIILADDLDGLVPKVYDYHPQGYWVEMEKVEVFDDYSRGWNMARQIGNLFEIFKRMDKKTINDWVTNFDHYKNLMIEIRKMRKYYYELHDDYDNNSDKIEVIRNEWKKMTDDIPFYHQFEDVFGIMEKANIDSNKLKELANKANLLKKLGITDLHGGNLGLNSNGDYVIVDFGMEDDVASRYYQTGLRRDEDPNFSTEEFFAATSEPRPAYGQ